MFQNYSFFVSFVCSTYNLTVRFVYFNFVKFLYIILMFKCIKHNKDICTTKICGKKLIELAIRFNSIQFINALFFTVDL